MTLDDLEKLEKAATPGPWEHDLDVFDSEEYEIQACVTNGKAVDLLALIATGVHARESGDADPLNKKQWALARESKAQADAAFIAAARNALPELIKIARAVADMAPVLCEWHNSKGEAACQLCDASEAGPYVSYEDQPPNGDGTPESNAAWDAYRAKERSLREALITGIEHDRGCAWVAASKMAGGGQ